MAFLLATALALLVLQSLPCSSAWSLGRVTYYGEHAGRAFRAVLAIQQVTYLMATAAAISSSAKNTSQARTTSRCCRKCLQVLLKLLPRHMIPPGEQPDGILSNQVAFQATCEGHCFVAAWRGV
jgi:hypothetical protein